MTKKVLKSDPMRARFERHGVLFLSIFAAVSILIAAIAVKGTEHENAWLYLTALWIVLLPLCELYAKKRRRSN